MPIYEYVCEECGHKFEKYYKSLAYFHNPVICEKCFEFTAVRIISISNFNAIDLRCQRLFGHDLKGRWTSEMHKAEAKD